MPNNIQVRNTLGRAHRHALSKLSRATRSAKPPFPDAQHHHHTRTTQLALAPTPGITQHITSRSVHRNGLDHDRRRTTAATVAVVHPSPRARQRAGQLPTTDSRCAQANLVALHLTTHAPMQPHVARTYVSHVHARQRKHANFAHNA